VVAALVPIVKRTARVEVHAVAVVVAVVEGISCEKHVSVF